MRGSGDTRMDGLCLELAGKAPAQSLVSGAEERELIRRAQDGDRPAFDLLVRQYDQTVLRLVLQMVGSTDEARDLYQEAFLKVYRSLRRFRLDARFSTWLYRVVMNVCFDYFRRQQARKEVQVSTEDGEEQDYFSKVSDDRPVLNPERVAQARQIQRRIERALSRLNPRERLVFELRHYQGLKLRAIGELCDTTEQTVKNCLFRATQKLRGELGDLV
jgi:RNA polymerase sigma-70 factor, ECF subfamily